MNTLIYTTASVLAASLCLGDAFYAVPDSENVEDWIAKFVVYLMSSKVYTLILMNMAYNLLFLFGKVTQVLFFGQLRADERNNISDRLLNYILFKIVFVGAVLEPDLAELLVWTSWFSILGFLKIFSLLARDRFEWLVTTMSQSKSQYFRILTLLLIVLLSDVCWFTFCVIVFEEAGPSVLLLLTFECFTLFLDTVQTLIKFAIHFRELQVEGGDWEQRVTYVYYTELITDSLILVATLGHYLQILYLHGISFTLIDAVLFLNMRLVFNNLRDKLSSYRNYRKLADEMNTRYEDVPEDELRAHDDNCAICHCAMTAAKRLPCGHIFHKGCILQWIERSPSCPTCRRPLLEDAAEHTASDPAREREENGGWFQSMFSHFATATPTRNVSEDDVLSVSRIFPHIPVDAIRADLERTGSREMTTENILQGTIQLAAPGDGDTGAAAGAAGGHGSVPLAHGSSGPGGSTVDPLAAAVDPAEEARARQTLEDTTFAQTAAERQRNLQARREAMKQQARKKYLERKKREDASKQHESAQTSQSGAPSSTGDVDEGNGLSSSHSATERTEPPEMAIPAPRGGVVGEAASEPGSSSVSGSPLRGSMDESIEMRRRRALEAAERRMRQLG